MGVLQVLGVVKTLYDLVVQIWGAVTGKKRSTKINEAVPDAKTTGDTSKIDDALNNS